MHRRVARGDTTRARMARRGRRIPPTRPTREVPVASQTRGSFDHPSLPFFALGRLGRSSARGARGASPPRWLLASPRAAPRASGRCGRRGRLGWGGGRTVIVRDGVAEHRWEGGGGVRNSRHGLMNSPQSKERECETAAYGGWSRAQWLQPISSRPPRSPARGPFEASPSARLASPVRRTATTACADARECHTPCSPPRSLATGTSWTPRGSLRAATDRSVLLPSAAVARFRPRPTRNELVSGSSSPSCSSSSGILSCHARSPSRIVGGVCRVSGGFLVLFARTHTAPSGSTPTPATPKSPQKFPQPEWR